MGWVFSKKMRAGLLLVSAWCTGHAQTITKQSFPQRDLVRYEMADANGFPVIETKINATWKFYQANRTGKIREEHYRDDILNPIFPQADMRGVQDYSIGRVQATQNVYYTKNDQGLFIQGYEYEPQQKIKIGHLAGTAGDPDDEILINVQFEQFIQEPKIVEFPLLTNKQWSWGKTSPMVIKTEFTMTLATAGLKDVKCTLLSKYEADYNSINTGVCQIPTKFSHTNLNGNLVRLIQTRRDSLYVNGAPATQQVLDILGIQQGAAQSTYQYYFYRFNGGMQCAAIITFTANDFTTIKSAEITREFDGLSAGENNNSIASIYPNPAGREGFSVLLENADENAQFTLTDITGKIIPVTATPSGAGLFTISPGIEPAPGVYMLEVRANNTSSVSKVIIQ